MDFGAGAAGTGIAHFPEVVFFRESQDAVFGDPAFPVFPGFIVGRQVLGCVALKNGDIAISQSIEDFADSKIAKAIFSCSSVKWILRQNTSRRELVQKVLSLNDREMDLIDSVTSKKGYFSEAFLISGDDKQVVKIESTPLEYWLSTTDPIDMKKMDELKADYPDTLSLFKYLAEKYPHGAS